MKHSCRKSYCWSWLVLLFHCMWKTVVALNCDVYLPGSSSAVTNSGQISAPSFPASYAREDAFYTCTYTLNNTDANGAIRLVFDDFHLDATSSNIFVNGTHDYLQIDIGDDKFPLTYTGINRPPPLLSAKNSIVVTLGVQTRKANSYSGLRTFSAQYFFISTQEKNTFETIYTEFGTIAPPTSHDEGVIHSLVPNAPGYIPAVELDRIWYIETEPHFKILFRIIEFTKRSSDDVSMIEIRDGLTSESEPLFLARTASPGYHVVSTQEMLYVRWKGKTIYNAALKAEFTYFIESGSGMQCPANYFQCDNYNCIAEQLTCNSRANCEDGSDEDTSSLCQGRTTTAPTCDLLCLNGGICIAGACRCPDTFFGDSCQFVNGTNNNFTDLQHTSIMIGAFVGAVCLLSVCWLIAMAKKRYTDEPPQGGRINRIVSVHSPAELGLRRNTTVVGEQDIPPDYSIVCRRDSRQGSFVRPGSFARRGSYQLKRYRPSIDSMGPLSPPPSYDIVVTGEMEENSDGIFITIPESGEERNLPDVVTSEPQPPVPSQITAPQPVSQPAPQPTQGELVNASYDAEPSPEDQEQLESHDDSEPTSITTTRLSMNTVV